MRDMMGKGWLISWLFLLWFMFLLSNLLPNRVNLVIPGLFL